MAKRAVLLFILIACQLTASVDARPVNVFGAGAQSCGYWLKARHSGRWADVGGWALGMASGYNLYAPASKQIYFADYDGFWAEIDQYCEENPLNAIPMAVADVIQQLGGEPIRQ